MGRARDWMVAAADLLVGADCAGCGRAAIGLCAECRAMLRPRPVDVPECVVPCSAGAVYEAHLASVIGCYKEEGRFALADVLADHLAAAVAAVAAPGPLALVPVPTSRRAVARRGFDHLAEVACGAATTLRAAGTDARVVPALRLRRRVRDQAGLDVRRRRANVHDAFEVRRATLVGSVVVVDDVTTTGATLAEGVRALESAGIPVDAAAVVAVTPAP